jgi:hypothetical protein
MSTDIDRLAALIREVDGNHTLGASALAEALIDAGVYAPSDDMADLRAERDRLAEQVQRVRDLHSVHMRAGMKTCAGCATSATFTYYEQCKTLAALDGGAS